MRKRFCNAFLALGIGVDTFSIIRLDVRTDGGLLGCRWYGGRPPRKPSFYGLFTMLQRDLVFNVKHLNREAVSECKERPGKLQKTYYIRHQYQLQRLRYPRRRLVA